MKNPHLLIVVVLMVVPTILEGQSKNEIAQDSSYQTVGVENNLPVFSNGMKSRLVFPMSWLSGNYSDFDSWRQEARSKFLELLMPRPPKVPFDPVVLAEEDRGSYVAQKIALNITSDSRVLAYLLVPKGEGPFPAVVLLHDHSAKFEIGKEKVIRPFQVSQETARSAEDFVKTMYGGRFIGDELAKRGYVCFSTDALNWGDRGGGGYQGQQAISSNLMLVGSSFAGLMAWEDLGGLEYLSGHDKVNPEKIASMGLSMGSYRAWRLAAMSEKIAAGVAICWMSTIKNLLQEGINVSGGNSAHSMVHPGMLNYFDYPDVASIACPNPMLFYNGLQDGLFPINSVEEAYNKLHEIWKSQGVENKLETKLWDVPHEFNTEMQEAAFMWLDNQLGQP